MEHKHLAQDVSKIGRSISAPYPSTFPIVETSGAELRLHPRAIRPTLQVHGVPTAGSDDFPGSLASQTPSLTRQIFQLCHTSRAGSQLSTSRSDRSENARIPDAQMVIFSHSPVPTDSPETRRLNENSISGSSSQGRQKHV